MLKNISNLGTVLSKQDQQKVKGGQHYAVHHCGSNIFHETCNSSGYCRYERYVVHNGDVVEYFANSSQGVMAEVC